MMKLTEKQKEVLIWAKEGRLMYYEKGPKVFINGRKLNLSVFKALKSHGFIQANYTGLMTEEEGRYVRYGVSPAGTSYLVQKEESATEAKLREYHDKRRAKELRHAAASDRWTDAELLKLAKKLLEEEDGQDVAEYAVMLAVIIVLIVTTVHLIGSSASSIFSQIGSKIQ